eukprot:2595389-Amphidinium_carterae.1
MQSHTELLLQGPLAPWSPGSALRSMSLRCIQGSHPFGGHGSEFSGDLRIIRANLCKAKVPFEHVQPIKCKTLQTIMV